MEEEKSSQEKTEAPSEERREQFRKRGEVVQSKELTSIIVLGFLLVLFSFYLRNMLVDLISFFDRSLKFSSETLPPPRQVLSNAWLFLIKLIAPIFVLSASSFTLITFMQTKFNISSEKLTFDLNRINPVSGFKRLFSKQSLVELFKSLGKFVVVLGSLGVVFYGEEKNIPNLMNIALIPAWTYWATTLRISFGIALFFLLTIGIVDYINNYFTLEKKMKMTKQEVKEELKNKELDPLIKGRLRKMQREAANRRTVEATKKATVIITNPTHYSIAIRYKIGMPAPVLIAKGKDKLAFKMRKIANELEIPIVENKPIARLLYKTIKIDQEIPESLYEALSKIISYVLKTKGKRLS